MNADESTVNRHLGSGTDDLKDHDGSSKDLHESWRFTPSLMDPNSFAFSSFANQPPGYYTPTPGGMNTVYHNAAGDLHTPGLAVGIGTPLSLPSSSGIMQSGAPALDMHAFSAHDLHQQHQFQSFNPFADQQTFAPSQFSHQLSAYEPTDMDADGDISPTEDVSNDQSPTMLHAPRYDGSMPAPPLPALEKWVNPRLDHTSHDPQTNLVNRFRFHTVMNAPTAMIKHSDEIPITYLNKGQAYSMSITDTTRTQESSLSAAVTYRTFIRVSFEDEEQRQRPGSCWQLWKEGRGTNEAHLRGGKLQAVEYVEAASGDDESDRTKVEIESASFDGFSVLWSPPPNGPADFSVSVRFNFLSTDFSHSKGVKGIPVRLCAKTELVSIESSSDPAEVCYCKVKLFRDHGAERKLSNDVAHVKKTIDKLRQQIAQAESGLKDFGKRKRSGSAVTKPALNPKAGKIPKHKRTWSVSSMGSGGAKTAEDDLHSKLATMQDMFTSTRPVSVLYLQGAEEDDPDRYPVQLSTEPLDLLKASISRENSWQQRESGDDAPSGSSLVSPSASSGSYHPRALQRTSLSAPTSIKRSPQQSSIEWMGVHAVTSADLQMSNPQHLASPPDQLSKVQRLGSENTGSLTGWIEAIGVDPAYQPPAELPIKPVACLYILRQEAEKPADEQYYRAVYVMQRTVKDFVNALAAKCEVESTRILRTTRVNSKGLNILVDDDVIRDLPEGQDMIVDFSTIEIRSAKSLLPTDEIVVDGVDAGPKEGSATKDTSPKGYELKLFY
jgi:hypothetical protein